METTHNTLPDTVDEIRNDLKEIKRLLEKNNTIEIPQNRWLSLTELCEYLPDKPARATIYGKIDEIPHYKDGKKLRFLKSEIDAWLLRGKRKTPAEIDQETNEFLSTQKKRG